MVLRGLGRASHDALAHDIARNHVENVTGVFEQTGTLWENYAPESTAKGNPSRGDFVGWGGIGPIAVLLENVLGIRPDAGRNRLIWDIHLLEAHGVRKYPFAGGGTLDLACARRESPDVPPEVRITADNAIPVEVELRWQNGTDNHRRVLTDIPGSAIS